MAAGIPGELRIPALIQGNVSTDSWWEPYVPTSRLTLLLLAALLFASLCPAPVVYAVAPSDVSAPAPGPGDNDPTLYTPVLEAYRDEAYARSAGHLSRYRVDAVFSPAGDEEATITGRLDLNYVNQTGEVQPAIYFRLYPNGEEYAAGNLELTHVMVADAPVNFELDLDRTVARVPLPSPVPPGGTVDLRLEFTTTIPTDPPRSYGMFSFDQATGTYALAHWLPLLAGYDEEMGWNLEPLSVHGDPVFTNTALFDVTLTVPEDLVVVTTGNEVATHQSLPGLVRRQYVSGPVRDFVIVIDDDFQSDSLEVGGTRVTSWFNPNSEDGGLNVLLWGVQSLELFNRLFGAYPYSELDLVQVDLGNGAAGVEFPQLVFIGADHYHNSALTRRIPGYLEMIVVHEVAHQWWYGIVGNNNYLHAFIDEGLTNYVSAVYFQFVYGQQDYELQVNLNFKAPYLAMLFAGGGDQIADQPTDDFPSQGAYGTTIYAKSALGFQAIRQEIGDDAFFGALTNYADQFAFRFEIATPADLLAAFEQSSGQELDELWRHWFEAAEGYQDFAPADREQLQRELGR